MKYRREIDGLRAVAVLPVIFFHAGFSVFSGGYIGVDVFFVISGYLITSILISELEQGKFSIARFYERRARRILPALFFVMLACLPFSWLFMNSIQMKDFAQSLVAVVFFGSNILFWLESGYFSADAELKPLLHTWSLAVEEQYYLLFPIFLLLAWRFGLNKVFWSVVVIAAISLLLSEWGWRNKPTANFYLAPTRAWELLAGSLCAFLTVGRTLKSNNVLSTVGLAAIVFAIFGFDENTPFPGVYALVPVFGTALIILFGKQGTWVAKLLSMPPFVGIGLISYSAYLWHQPLFAFARLRSVTEPSHVLMAVLAVAALLLAWGTWRWVEQPFRHRGALIKSLRLVFALSLVGALFFLSLGIWGHLANGFSLEPIANNQKIPYTPIVNTNFIILGDSHAQHLVSGIEEITSGTVTSYTAAGCIPFRNVDRYDSRFRLGNCANFINSNLDQIIEADEESTLLISTMGPVYLDGTTFKGKAPDRVRGLRVELVTDPSITDNWLVFEIGMRNTLTELSLLQNVEVIFVIDVPELGIGYGCQAFKKQITTPYFTLSDTLEPLNTQNCISLRSEYDDRTGRYRELVTTIVGDFPKIGVFDPTNYYCDDEACFGYLDAYGFLYRDPDHLSLAGSRYLANALANSLENIFNN
jgi:peptidoglycan/LPS O-acetylase OafA/YrhL